MKKSIMFVLFFLGLGVSTVFSQNLYKVTVTVQKITHYYNDENHYDEAFSATSVAPAQTDEVCASTPERAKDIFKSDCETMCSRSERSKGRQWNQAKGKYYYVTEELKVYDAQATYLRPCN